MKRRSNSPWNAGPFCASRRAVERWDWKKQEERLKEINASREKAGLPPIKDYRSAKAAEA